MDDYHIPGSVASDLKLNNLYTPIYSAEKFSVLKRSDILDVVSSTSMEYLRATKGNFVLASTLNDKNYFVYGAYDTEEEANSVLTILEMLRNG
jgi:hypothetical protein